MTDETNDDEKPKRPELKSLEDFKPEEYGKPVLDFAKAKEKKHREEEGCPCENCQPSKLKTRFCIEHKEGGATAIFNFNVEKENGGYMLIYTAKREVPFLPVKIEQTVASNFVKLTRLENFLQRFGLGITLEEKVEKEAILWKEEVIEHFAERIETKELNESFKL